VWLTIKKKKKGERGHKRRGEEQPERERRRWGELWGLERGFFYQLLY